jgi:aspartate aminotransferase
VADHEPIIGVGSVRGLQRTESIIQLARGDPDFATPSHIKLALYEAVAQGYTHYADHRGDPELISIISQELTARGGCRYSPGNVLVTHGASGALAASILALIRPGQRVLIPTPTYPLYADLVRLAGGQPVYLPKRDDFTLNVDEIVHEAAAATMIIVCNPCNPTGAVFEEEELAQLAEAARVHRAYLVVDEAYDHLVFDERKFYSCLDMHELGRFLIYVQSFSKSYAMCGWRIGYMAAHEDVIGAALHVQERINGPINSAVQRAAIVALAEQNDFATEILIEYQQRRDLVCDLLAHVPGIELRAPQGTFYVFPRFSGQLTSTEMAARALRNGVAVRAGTDYGPGGERCIRLALCASSDLLSSGVERLTQAVQDV